MKKLIIILVAFSLLLVSSYAMASVHGAWNVDRIEKSILKIGKAKPVTEIENIPDVWLFKDDNSFTSTYLLGAWSQKGASFTITVAPEQMSAFIESEFLSEGMPVSATIKKLRIYGSEKKDWTIKGKYEIKASLVFPDSSTGTLDIKGSFTGRPPYDTAEYFPLGQGDTWTTKEIDTEDGENVEEIETTLISGTEKIKGVFAVKKIQVDDNPAEVDYDLWTNTNGLKHYKSYDIDFDEDVVEDEDITTYNPPVMYLPPWMSVGTRHAFKSTITAKEIPGSTVTVKLTGNVTVEGFEEVEVPAGKFADCIKIKIVSDFVAKKTNATGHEESTVWLAKGVGVVREEGYGFNNEDGETNESTWISELLSATVSGVNYP
jgi:hypothetical protein